MAALMVTASACTTTGTGSGDPATRRQAKAAFVNAGKQVKDDTGGTAKAKFTSRAEYPSFKLDEKSPAVVHARQAALR
jgi:hypothetical protein